MPEEIIKVKFKSCLIPDPKTIKFVGEDDKVIGSVTLRPLLRKEIAELVGKTDEEFAVVSISSWTFKDEKGKKLPITLESFLRLNMIIQNEIFKILPGLNFISEIEEKN